MSRTKNSIINAVTGITGQLLIVVLKFVTRTVFIHTLGKAYLGINGLFADILSMLALTELGLDTAINYKLYKPLAERDEKRIRLLMTFYRDAYRIVGFAILVLGISLVPFLHFLINDYESLGDLGINATLIFFLYLMQSVSSYLFFAYRSAVVKADQKEFLLNIAGYVISISTNLCQIIILLFWKSFVAFTACVVAFNIIQNIVNSIIAKKYYPYAFIRDEDRLQKKEIKDILKDLGALFVYKVNNVVVKATDNMVLSTFIGLSVVGMYSNYLMFYSTINSLFSRLYSAVKASMGNLYATGNIKQKYQFFEIMNFISALLYGTACVGIVVVANEFIVNWVGEDYVIKQPFPLLIGIEIIFVGLKNNLGQIRNVSGIFRQMWFRPVIGIIVNLGVSIALVQKLGIYGVLIGTIVASIVANFLVDPPIIYKYVFFGYKKVSDYYIRNSLYALTLAFTGIIDSYICSKLFVGYGWLSVILHSIICGISVPLVFFICFYKRHECQYLINKMRLIFHRRLTV